MCVSPLASSCDLELGCTAGSSGRKKGLRNAAPDRSLKRSAVGDVHRDFEAETHFGVLRLAPHGVVLSETHSGDYSPPAQRLAMYIVTSKPKRISVYSGLLHMASSFQR
jgi:hypothetical protein